MREHPVPQDITGYQFHIIGDMTIKQFAEVALGVIIAGALYLSNLYIFIKWPLMFVAFSTGVLAAFVPYEQQPLDHWIVTFFKTLYKPTQYYWKKDARLPEAFSYSVVSTTTIQPEEIDMSPSRRERIKEYLVSLPEEAPMDPYLSQQQERIDRILQSFDTDSLSSGGYSINTTPNIKITTHSLSLPSSPDAIPALPTESHTITPQTTLNSVTASTYQVVPEYSQNTTTELSTNSAGEQHNEVIVPQDQPVQIATTSQIVDPATQPAETVAYSQPSSFIATIDATHIDTQGLQTALGNTQLPFPSLPTQPNRLVGMTLSTSNELLNEVIVEIKTTAGQVVRAVKSNSLGQFFISTPLRNGTYVVTAEKEDYQFADLQLILNGSIVAPLEIRSV